MFISFSFGLVCVSSFRKTKSLIKFESFVFILVLTFPNVLDSIKTSSLVLELQISLFDFFAFLLRSCNSKEMDDNFYRLEMFQECIQIKAKKQ